MDGRQRPLGRAIRGVTPSGRMDTMKRAIFGKAWTTVILGVLATACTPADAPRQSGDAAAGTAADWTRPPEITTVQRAGDTLVFTGTAEPEGRVVLRNDSGAAYAAAADARGRFEIRMDAPASDLWLSPETQVGQDAATSPDRLLIVAGGRGPIAILRAGGPTRRLDRAPVLGAVDSDGRMRMASGRTAGAEALAIRTVGEAVQVTPDASGRWSLMLRPSNGPDDIQVGEDRFAWPGEAEGASTPGVERAGQGWRVTWTGAGGARQSTWLPDGA